MTLPSERESVGEGLARIAKQVATLIAQRDEYREKLIRSERDLAEAEARITELEAPAPLRIVKDEKRTPYEVIHGDG
jgi:hypothetical protein